MWTLWLITQATVIAQGGATPVVTPLAIYQAQADCQAALSEMYTLIKSTWGKEASSPGMAFCLRGTTVNR